MTIEKSGLKKRSSVRVFGRLLKEAKPKFRFGYFQEFSENFTQIRFTYISVE